MVVELAMAATLCECLGGKCHFCPEICITDISCLLSGKPIVRALVQHFVAV